MVTTVSPEALSDGRTSPGKLIDVRSAAEFAIGHIPGAVNVPLEQVEARLGDIGEGPLVLICEAGACHGGGGMAQRPAACVRPRWRQRCVEEGWISSGKLRALPLDAGTAGEARSWTDCACGFGTGRNCQSQVDLHGDVHRCRFNLRGSYQHLRHGRLAGPHAMESRIPNPICIG